MTETTVQKGREERFVEYLEETRTRRRPRCSGGVAPQSRQKSR